jgi:hypothetical protein
MRMVHAPHATCSVEQTRVADLYPPRRHPAFLSLLAGWRSSLREAVIASFKLRPCSPLEQGLIVFSDSVSKTFSFGSNTLTFLCATCMADMSVTALRKGVDIRIFSWSMRRSLLSSSQEPSISRHGFKPNLLPRLGPNGKRRFLLPRPFATTFIRLHLRMEPLFFPARFELGIQKRIARLPTSRLSGLAPAAHIRGMELRPSPPPWPRPLAIGSGRWPEGLAHPLERGLFCCALSTNRRSGKNCRPHGTAVR